MSTASERDQAPRGVVTVVDDGEAALCTAEALLAAGIAPERIGLVGKDTGAMRAGLDAIGFPVKPSLERPAQLAERLAPPGRDELVGAAVGGVAGLAAGLAPFLIPGLGPLLFAYGGLAMIGDALLTSALGAGVGLFFGGLFELGVEAHHQDRWQRALKTGGWLVVVRGDRADVERAAVVFVAQPTRHTDLLTS